MRNIINMNKKQTYLILFFIITLKFPSYSQQLQIVEIKGEIIDETYEPISFTNIASKKTGYGTISNEDGEFRIRILENDTLIFSALSYVKKEIPVKQLFMEKNYVILKKNIYQIGEVNVMGLRWQEFKYEMMNKELEREEQAVIVIEDLPNPFQKRIDIGPYAGSSNPLSMLLTYFKEENRRKRKQKRWRNTYRKSWIEVQ